MPVAAAWDSPNGLRLDNAPSGLRLAQLIEGVARLLIPLPPFFSVGSAVQAEWRAENVKKTPSLFNMRRFGVPIAACLWYTAGN